MRIYVKDNSGRTFKIPAPLSLVSFCCRIANFTIIRSSRFIPEDSKQYLDCIDFNELAGCINLLKKYNGLVLVHVKSSTGEEVKITI